MNKSTLRERRLNSRLSSLHERLITADERLIQEQRRQMKVEALILEAFDKRTMAAAIEVIKQLKSLDFGKLASLAAARDAAVADVNRELGGSKQQGLVRRIVNLFSSQKENSFVDALAFADATKNFFDQFSQYVTALNANGPDSQTLGSLVTGKSSEELDDLSAVKGLGGDEKKRLSDLQKVIISGLKPQGALAAVGKNWIDKYLKGRKGLQQLARDLLKMPVRDLLLVSKNVSASLKNASAVGQAAAGAAQQAAVSTDGSTGSNPSNASQPEQGSASTKTNNVASGAQSPSDPVVDKAFDAIKPDLGGEDEAATKKIIAALAAKDMIKT